MSITVPRFSEDKDFGCIYLDIFSGEHSKHPYFNIHDGYLFQGTQLCLPTTSIHKHVVRELHVGGCSGHLSRDKTLALIDDRYF